MDIKKYFLICMMAVLMLQMVSAFEFDNVLKVEENGQYDILHIDNVFGLGKRIATLELIENTDQCLIDCYSIINVTIYEEMPLFTVGDFVNKQGHIKNLIFNVYTESENRIDYEVNDYESVCDETLLGNGSIKKENCITVITGTHEEEIITYDWKKYKGKNLVIGSYLVKIEAKKERKESIDWTFSYIGISEEQIRNEWAWWNSDFAYKRELYFNTSSTSNIRVPYRINSTGGVEGLIMWTLPDLSFDTSTNHTEYFYYNNYTSGFHVTNYSENVEQGIEAENESSTNSVNAGKVWEDYVLVTHFKEGTGTSATDSTDYSNTITLTSPDWAVGKFGHGMECNGGGAEYGTILDANELDFTTSFTIMAWIYPNTNFKTNYLSVAGKGYIDAYTVGASVTTGQLRMWLKNTAHDGNAPLIANQWQHVVYMWNGTTIQFFINGESDYIASQTTSLTPNSNNVIIGNSFAGGWNSNARFDEIRMSNRSFTDDEIRGIYQEGTFVHSSFGAEDLDDEIKTTLNTPSDLFNTTNPVIDFNCTTEGVTGILNLTLILDDAYNYTIFNSTANVNLTLLYSPSLSEGSHNWTCIGNDGLSTNTPTARSLYIDSTAPVVSIANNITNLTTLTLPISSHWNYTTSDLNLDKCYYNTTDNATLSIVTCNVASIETSWTTGGNKNITYCANDTFGSETCRTSPLIVYFINYSQSDSPDPVGEGTFVDFTLQVNRSNIPVTTAYLVFNNTNYTSNATANTNSYNFSTSIEMLSGWGNNTGNAIDWYWLYTIDGVLINSSTVVTDTTVFSLEISVCGAFTDVVVNMSLKDEETNTLLNVSAETTNLEIDLTLTSGAITLSYADQWTNDNNVALCVPSSLLNNTNYTMEFVIGFDASDHVNEFYYMDNGLLSQSEVLDSLTKKTISLMDLLTTDSTSFLFNYFDSDGLVVQNITVHVFRQYIGEGLFREVERSKQNDDGDTIVHLVEEDVLYYFIISQAGNILFTSNTYTALCQDTPCEIQLEESGGFQEFDDNWQPLDNGAYTLQSNSGTRVVNLTYSLTSASTMNLTIYKLDPDFSYSIIGSAGATGTSGSLLVTVPIVSGNTSFFATVSQDGEFKSSEWIDFDIDMGLSFGNTLSLFLGALIILALGLMGITEGSGVIIFLLLGAFISMVLGIVDYRTPVGTSIFIYLVLAGCIILYRLSRRNR